MTEKHALIAFESVLLAIVVLFALACFLLYLGRSVEAIGIGGVMTGLIGILGTFKPRTNATTATTDSGDVNVDTKEGKG